MTVGAVVQARMGSQRLPGKVAMPLGGRPALAWLLERLAHAETLDAIVVATSDACADDVVCDLCARLDVRCHRGPEDDVAQRLLDAADELGLEGFVRVNGDSPLLDQALVNRGVRLFRGGAFDLVTNVHPRTFPRGQSVEVVRTEALRAALPRLTQPGDREHVTQGLYRELQRIENFAADEPSDMRLVLDTPEDVAPLEGIFAALERPHWQYGWRELVELTRVVLS